MSKIVLGNEMLISVSYIAEILGSLAPDHLDKSSINWRAKAACEIKAAEDQEAEHPGTCVSAESIFNRIFNRVLDGQITWI